MRIVAVEILLMLSGLINHLIVLSSKRVSVAKESPISFAYVIQVSERTANER